MAGEIGLGATFSYETTPASGTYTAIANIRSITPPDASVDVVDVTTFGDTAAWKQYIAGLIEGGEAEITLLYDPESAVNATLHGILTGRAVRKYKIVFSGGGNVIFDGIMTNIGHEVPIDDAVAKSITVKQTGAPTWAVA